MRRNANWLRVLLLAFGALHFGGAWAAESATEVNHDNYYNLMVSTYSGGDHEGYIKFSVLMALGGKIEQVYFQTNDIKFHQEFLAGLPGTPFHKLNPTDTPIWRQLTMLKASRRALLASVSFRSQPGQENSGNSLKLADVQFLSEDPLSAIEVAALLKLVRERIKLETVAKISYWPDSYNQKFVHDRMSEFSAAGVEVFSPNSSLKQYCYSNGWIAGPVKKIKATELGELMNRGEIDASMVLVMDEAPRDLPMLTGLLVGEVSSEASHPALQAQAAGVPFVYLKDVFSSAFWDQLDRQGRSVFVQSRAYAPGSCQLVVKDDSDLNERELKQLQELHRPLPVKITPPELKIKQLVDLDQLTEKNLAQVGGKAANLGRLRKIIGPNHSVSEGIAIPLSFYHRFVREAQTRSGEKLICAIQTELQTLGADLGNFGKTECGTSSPSSRRTTNMSEVLTRVRELIENGELPQGNTQPVQIMTALQGKWPKGTRLRFRSSANVEDGSSINAAGAYDSGSACLGDDESAAAESVCGKEYKKSPVWKRIRKVWASLYSLKGFSIRQRYKVDEESAAMGVLVHRPFSDEVANGVAVTQYSSETWRAGRITTTSTGFPGELAVTNPPVGKTPETVRVDLEEDFDRFKLLVPSSEVPVGQRLMSTAMYEQLAQLTKKVHEYYQPLYAKDPTKYQLDFEWKLEGENPANQKIVIKQVRPVPIPEFGSPLKGRGTFLVGDRSKRLCPVPGENPDALAKLKLSHSLRIGVALHEIPLTEVSEMPTPIESLEVSVFNDGKYQPAKFGSRLRLSYDTWTETTEKLKEDRTVVASTDVTLNDEPFELSWVITQRRTKSVPEYLTDSMSSFADATIQLRSKLKGVLLPEGLPQQYRVVGGQGGCEHDAYQGSQPGTQPEAYHPEWRKARPLNWEMPNAEGKRLAIETEGRTAFGGFDKTSFVHLDSVKVKGLLAQDLIIRGGTNAVYAPAHHNFAQQIAVDLYRAEGLTPAQKSELVKANVRYLVLPEGGVADGVSSRTNQRRKWKVTGVSEDLKKKKVLGRVYDPQRQF